MKAGDRYGRWALLRYGPHGERRGGMRSRYTCRCVCGVEQAVWQEDLVGGRSTGCASATCRTAHEGLLASLDVHVPPAYRERIEAASTQDALVKGERVPSGWVVGRWQAVRHAAPQEVGGRSRPVVVVECVCGVQSLWREDQLKANRTQGCASVACRTRWLTACAVYERTQRALRGETGTERRRKAVC
jgi:hypothetical protein